MERRSLDFKEKMVQPILQVGKNRMVQLSLEAGQGLSKHKADLTLTVVVVSGRIRFSVGGEDFVLQASDLLTVEPRREHEVEALEKSIVMLVLMSDADVAPAQPGHAGHGGEDHVNAYTNPALLEDIAPELRSLVEDHIELCKELDIVHEPFDAQKYRHLLTLVGNELNQHFVYEEQILFPPLGAHLGGNDVGPVPKLLKEHRMIREMHAASVALQERLAKGDPVQQQLESQTHEMVHLLLNHIDKEDNHLFTMASRILTAEEKKTIGDELARRQAASAQS